MKEKAKIELASDYQAVDLHFPQENTSLWPVSHFSCDGKMLLSSLFLFLHVSKSPVDFNHRWGRHKLTVDLDIKTKKLYESDKWNMNL
jgi:hypothetical protein